MELTYLEAVILHLLRKINGERTIYSIFHLLQGKRSSQTIQDAHLYQLTSFFHSYPFITRSQLEKEVNNLIDKGLAVELDEKKVKLTSNGRQELDRKLAENPLPVHMNGWKYHQVTILFWDRLTLFLQVCSNLVHHERSYVPVRNKKETLIWVKRYIQQQEEDRYKLAEKLYEELTSALHIQDIRPELIVFRLTGFKKIGLTPVQAAEMTDLELAQYHFEFLNGLHAMIEKIHNNPICFPILNGLIKQPDQTVPLTQSTEKTFKMLAKGYTLEEIAAARNLKESTVEDHVVEIVLSMREFEIDTYVLPEKQKRVLAAVRQVSAKKLKQIREQVEDASYFEIRLVLAKYGDVKWN
jgi:uncharacterized protein YpbB